MNQYNSLESNATKNLFGNAPEKDKTEEMRIDTLISLPCNSINIHNSKTSNTNW